MNQRIGIYSGTFNPVHAGHISFALQAASAADLDAVYFMPERRPRYKTGIEHFGHRAAMLNRATRPHTKLNVLELEDVNFSIERTLPKLQKRFAGDQLVLLVGSDEALKLQSWPKIERLLKQWELVVGVRAQDSLPAIETAVASWPSQPKDVVIFQSYAASVSSGKVREALSKREYVEGSLSSVARYSEHHWLYISLAAVASRSTFDNSMS